MGAGDLPMLLQYLPAVMATNCLGASTDSRSENQAPAIFAVVVFVYAHRSTRGIAALPRFEAHLDRLPCGGCVTSSLRHLAVEQGRWPRHCTEVASLDYSGASASASNLNVP